MENPEEVLQALDEFQKMRPTEIPRELEDYLCWVAKTGDPVYQWSLIKVLFREKLNRVMSDFYEGSPSVDSLASCPNLEHFNYDTMKSTLLERLESFASAPFTVQRICELLTTSRKEYNRVDKFMRAIEKNILVVSTREPGPTARRSENGDGMVNGSVEDEVAMGEQTSEDIEMESWVKDCPTSTLPLHSSTETKPQLQDSSPNPSVVKHTPSPLTEPSEEKPAEQQQQSVEAESMLASTFVASNPDFLENASIDSNTATQEHPTTNTLQPPTLMHETSSSSSGSSGNSIVDEVPEAMMNEDTSSQPSLELEGDESEMRESSRKLKTTFHSKDFPTISEITDNHVSDTSSSVKLESDESVTSASVDFGALSRNNGAHLVVEEVETEKRNFADIGNEDNAKSEVGAKEEDDDCLGVLVEEPHEDVDDTKKEEPEQKENEDGLKIEELEDEAPVVEDVIGNDSEVTVEEVAEEKQEEEAVLEPTKEKVTHEAPKEVSEEMKEDSCEEQKQDSEKASVVTQVASVTGSKLTGGKRSAEDIEEPPAKIEKLDLPACTIENGQKNSETSLEMDVTTSSESVEPANPANTDSY